MLLLILTFSSAIFLNQTEAIWRRSSGNSAALYTRRFRRFTVAGQIPLFYSSNSGVMGQFWFSPTILLVACLGACILQPIWANGSTLVLLDEMSIRTTHSTFFKALQGKIHVVYCLI